MPKRNVADLVGNAAGDIQGEQPVKRGRGVAGMFGGDVDNDTRPQVDSPTIMQSHNDASGQADLYTSEQSDVPRPLNRVSRSYRVEDDIAYRFDVLATQQRRKLYEALEEAMLDYLAKYGG